MERGRRGTAESPVFWLVRFGERSRTKANQPKNDPKKNKKKSQFY